MTTTLLLARHAQSEWNEQRRWQGQADPPLTALGRRQAATAAQRVGALDVIIASDLDRALTTALIISEAIGVGPVLTDERLRERDAGPWSGLTRDEIEAGWPGYLEQRSRPEGYEPDESVWSRASAALADIATRFEAATALVVTHGGVIRTTVTQLGGDEPARLANLGAFELAYRSGRFHVGEHLHLAESGDGQPSGMV